MGYLPNHQYRLLQLLHPIYYSETHPNPNQQTEAIFTKIYSSVTVHNFRNLKYNFDF